MCCLGHLCVGIVKDSSVSHFADLIKLHSCVPELNASYLIMASYIIIIIIHYSWESH